MSKHSKIGASKAERWMNCPGSVAFCDTLPEAPTSIHAATGTIVHALGEKILKGEYEFELGGSNIEIDREYEQDGFTITVTEKMVEDAELYASYIRSVMQEHKVSFKDVYLEHRVEGTRIHPDAFGTCDCLINAPDELHVIDYKNGVQPVEVAGNVQLMLYALYASMTLNVYKPVVLTIVQPNRKDGGPAVQSYRPTPEECTDFGENILKAIERVEANLSRKENWDLMAGAHCKWCSAIPVCPSHKKMLELQTGVRFSKIDTDGMEIPELEYIDPERLSHLVRNVELVQQFCKQALSLAHGLAKKGTTIPGYKLITKYGNRKWINEKEAVARYEKEFGDDAFTMKFKSPAQLEKVLPKERRKEIEALVEKPETGVALVEDSHPAPQASPVHPGFKPIV